MTFFPDETYSVLYQVFDVLGLSSEQKREYTDAFEKRLTKKFLDAVYMKLPEQERQPLITLANTATTDDQKEQVKAKFKEWLTADEVKSLFRKISDDEFNAFLKYVYANTASKEQKKKLEEVFKIEVLHG